MDPRNSLIALAEFGLRASTSDSDRLAVYDAVAILAVALDRHGFSPILKAAKDASDALRNADEQQLKFRDLLSGEQGGTD